MKVLSCTSRVASIGGMVAAIESCPAAEGSVAAGPDEGVVNAGIGLEKDLRNDGVPNVSVKAIPRT